MRDTTPKNMQYTSFSNPCWVKRRNIHQLRASPKSSPARSQRRFESFSSSRAARMAPDNAMSSTQIRKKRPGRSGTTQSCPSLAPPADPGNERP